MSRLEDVRKLDVGSGLRPLEGYVGIDCCVVPPELADRVVCFNVCSGMPWPFSDGQMEAIAAHHFIEHVPAEFVQAHEHASGSFERSPVPTRFVRATVVKDALAWVLDECYRIAAPGAKLELSWPALVDDRTRQLQVAPFWDPTHRRFIPAEQIELFYNRPGREALKVEHYAIDCDWRVTLRQQRGRGSMIENYYVLEKHGGP